MKIIIVGAGFTGNRLAKRLITEEHDVVLIDKDEEIVRHASNRLDCMVMQASGNSLATLEEAGIATADAIVALTESDELNMITCSLVESVYPNVTKIARVRNDEYYVSSVQTNRRTYGIDFMVHPDQEAANEIVTAIEHGVLTDVVKFDGSDYELATFYIDKDSSFAGSTILDVRKSTNTSFLFAFIEKEKNSFFPSGSVVLEAGNRIGILVHKDERAKVLSLCGVKECALEKVALVGAGKIGTRVAEQLLENRTADKKSLFAKRKSMCSEFLIVDSDKKKSKAASENFPSANVFNADITDEGFIEEENLQAFDLVIAVTRNHDLNMIASAYMKTLGVRKTICLVQSSNYALIARDIGIDVSIPIKDAVVDSILSHLRGKSVKGVKTLTDGKLEVIELVIPEKCPILGKRIIEFSDLSSFIVLLTKKSGEEHFSIPTGETQFNVGDRVVFLMKTDDDFDALEIFGVGN